MREFTENGVLCRGSPCITMHVSTHAKFSQIDSARFLQDYEEICLSRAELDEQPEDGFRYPTCCDHFYSAA